MSAQQLLLLRSFLDIDPQCEQESSSGWRWGLSKGVVARGILALLARLPFCLPWPVPAINECIFSTFKSICKSNHFTNDWSHDGLDLAYHCRSLTGSAFEPCMSFVIRFAKFRDGPHANGGWGRAVGGNAIIFILVEVYAVHRIVEFAAAGSFCDCIHLQKVVVG